MAKAHSTTARTFTPIDLGNGKVIAPILAEGGKMEYQATYYGELIGFEGSESAARNKLNEHVYDLERGGMLYAVSTPTSTAEETNAPVELAPSPTSLVELGIDPSSRGARMGFAAGAFTGICRTVSQDRADRLMQWVADLDKQDATYLNTFIDQLLLIMPASPFSEQPGSGAGGWLGAAAYALYRQGRTDAEQAMIRAIENRIADSCPQQQTALSMSTISIEYLYHDADGDLTEEPIGPLVYLDYCCGEGDAKTGISFRVDGSHPPVVDSSHHDSLPLDQVLAMLPNLLALLADERVQAARVRFEAGAPMKKAA